MVKKFCHGGCAEGQECTQSGWKHTGKQVDLLPVVVEVVMKKASWRLHRKPKCTKVDENMHTDKSTYRLLLLGVVWRT